MKCIVVVGDGMADYPCKELCGKTPLQAARKPNMDMIASEGRVGLVKTVPDGMVPDSAVANLAILGYNPRKYFTGRGPLEAGAMGIKLGKNDVAFRCNLVTERGGVMADYSGGQISNEEAKALLEEVRKLGGGEYHLGVKYRHIFVMRNASIAVGCDPPHDIVGEKISKHMIGPEGGKVGKMLNGLMLSSKGLLSKHPVNIKRERAGKNPANMIWLWSPGRRPKLESFRKKYGLKGAMISAVNLINGIGVYAGMEVVKVPGATGYYDTNYEGKADYAIKALKKTDFVYVHVEAPDEAGHEGNARQKVRTIEDLDKRLLGRILDKVEGCRVAVLPDHPTPVSVKSHVSDPIPFAIYYPGSKGDGLRFDEASAKHGTLGFVDGPKFMDLFMKSR
ncbi:MAG: cofactor-independent phosphoglycerate mutase [Candidatus Hadarchaeota archaeon]